MQAATVASQPVLDLGFLGAGRMATALAVGWKHAGLVKLGHCQAADPHAAARDSFHQTTGFWVTEDNRALLRASQVVVLAVKPQQLRGVLADLRGDLGPEKLILSIVAGATLETLAQALGHQRVVRIMPNTPCQVGASASAFSNADSRAMITAVPVSEPSGLPGDGGEDSGTGLSAPNVATEPY